MEPKYIVKRADLEYNIRVLRNLAKGKVIWGVVIRIWMKRFRIQFITGRKLNHISKIHNANAV